MARAMLLALVFAAIASGARYADYPGVKMPQYGSSADYEGPRDVPIGSVDEYRDHSPEAPASLDYKYEEDSSESTFKSRSKVAIEREIEESDNWQKPESKKKRPINDDTDFESDDKFSPDEIVPNFKSYNNKRHQRLNMRNSERSGIYRHHDKYLRDQNEDRESSSENDFHVHQDHLHEIKNNGFENVKTRFGYRETTVRKIRRKPRDRFMKSPLDDEEIDNIEDSAIIKGLNKESRRDSDYSQEIEEKWFQSPGRQSMRRYDPDKDERKAKLIKTKPKNYEEYDNYYDMRRVYSIKNKLPALSRRTNKATITRTKTSQLPREDMIWSNRRFVPEPVEKMPPKTTSTTTTWTSPSTTSSAKATPQTQPSSTAKHDLSLAELSRLSILKKAQRKESFANGTTKKPPVLLQVATNMQTVVIVEPPSSDEPIFRAREVAEDTPDQLTKVKRMMRHKLVSNAKSIHELTDNWDEMVCDYIDVSLLENSANNQLQCYGLLYLIFILWRFI